MFTYFFLVIFLIWLLILTFILLRLKKHYYNLVSRTKKRNIDEIFDQLLANSDDFKRELDIIKKELSNEINNSRLHLQKIGLVRFSPFERGADQSFVLALLDGNNNGITINFIYTRHGLMVYAKKVKNGKGEEHELSAEEKKAIGKVNH